MRRRIIACIDGQEYDGHGQQSSSILTNDVITTMWILTKVLHKDLGNNSNIFRVWASIKKGTCETADGNKVEQVGKLEPTQRHLLAADRTMADQEVFSRREEDA